MIDFFDSNEEEKKELLEIMKQLKTRLNDLFKPDLFNYASLGNQIRHLHIHIIPRYKDKRIFENIGFFDKRWNNIHSPYEKVKLSPSVLNELKNQIRRGLK